MRDDIPLIEAVSTWSQLRGCTVGLRWPHKSQAERAIHALNTCNQHRGKHHFAVIGDGQMIACSTTGRQCLAELGLLPPNWECDA